jgi:hypothetical protein
LELGGFAPKHPNIINNLRRVAALYSASALHRTGVHNPTTWWLYMYGVMTLPLPADVWRTTCVFNCQPFQLGGYVFVYCSLSLFSCRSCYNNHWELTFVSKPLHLPKQPKWEAENATVINGRSVQCSNVGKCADT